MGEKEKFSKTDMERIGIFQEMGYISIQDKYKSGNASKLSFTNHYLHHIVVEYFNMFYIYMYDQKV